MQENKKPISPERQSFNGAIDAYREGIRGLSITEDEKKEMSVAADALIDVAIALGKSEAIRPPDGYYATWKEQRIKPDADSEDALCLMEIDAVLRKYKRSLGHEDSHGAFMLHKEEHEDDCYVDGCVMVVSPVVSSPGE